MIGTIGTGTKKVPQYNILKIHRYGTIGTMAPYFRKITHILQKAEKGEVYVFLVILFLRCKWCQWCHRAVILVTYKWHYLWHLGTIYALEATSCKYYPREGRDYFSGIKIKRTKLYA